MNDIVYVGRHALMHSVQRHTHDTWELVYCTWGTGTFVFDNERIEYQVGDTVVIPPSVPHANGSEQGFRNIHINMASPTLNIKKPAKIQDETHHFLLDAFTAAFFYYGSDRQERTAMLATYGDLIVCYLSAYQTELRRSAVVEEIANDIISNFTDSDYKLDAYLHSLPFSSDYLRKLFQKEMGLTPHQYLNDKRLKLAAETLTASGTAGVSVADVARMCGFRDPLYFSRMFKMKFGVSPSYYPADGAARRDAAVFRDRAPDA